MEHYAGERVKNGVLFISSFKAAENIKAFADEVEKKIKKKCIRVEDAFIDRNQTDASDIDRPSMKALIEGLDTGKYDVLVVRSLYDITIDESDWEAFLNTMADIDVEVYDLSAGCYVCCDYGEC